MSSAVYKKKIKKSEVGQVAINFLQFASAYTAANSPDAVLVMDVAYKIIGKKFFRWNASGGYWDFCDLEQVEKTRILRAFEKKKKMKKNAGVSA